jgi:threonine dehydrogenase-like Zn-dependent dehydrogenase
MCDWTGSVGAAHGVDNKPQEVGHGMRCLTVAPGQKDSIQLDQRPEPAPSDGWALIEAVALGVCGTDREIIAGDYGWAPPGESRLVLGHESLGRVLEAPAGSDLKAGDLVAGVVRRPDPVPCRACAVGEWDMCNNGRYTERGIKERDGYGAERYLLEPAFAIKIDPALGFLGVLLEPTSVVAKAWDHIERIGRRSRAWRAERLLVTGAGPVGLLAALLGRQQGLETHIFDRAASGPKPQLAADLGAAYHSGQLAELKDLAPNVIIECTGADAVVADAMSAAGGDAVVCLAGVSSGGRRLPFDVGGFNRQAVLGNEVVFGSVNANLAHYEAAAQALAKADKGWLARLISRRVPLDSWREAFEPRGDDVKVAIDFGTLPALAET